MDQTNYGLNLTVHPDTDSGCETTSEPEVSNSESLTVLFNNLIDAHLKGQQRACLSQPTYSRDVVRRRLRKVMFETLFENTDGRFRKSRPEPKNSLSAELELSSRIYGLRCHRQFDKANQLEGLLTKLKRGITDVDLHNNLLRFLVRMIDTVPEHDSAPIGHGGIRIPVVFRDKDIPQHLPAGPLLYGDTQLYYKQFSNMYMQYPSHIFHGNPVTLHNGGDINKDFINPKIFTSTPGKNLQGDGLFNVRGYLRDHHEKNTRQTLFGALCQKSHGNVNMKLGLPDLPDQIDSRYMDTFKLPKMEFEISSSKDEGFSSEGSTPLDDSALSQQSPADEDIWQLAVEALKHVPNRHYTWESVGRPPGWTEHPYLTEAGPTAVDVLQRQQAQNLSVIDKSAILPAPRLITMETLVKDVFNLLLALPSETFSFCEKSKIFSLTPGTHITGLTSEGLSNLCNDALTCGTNHWRLTVFAVPPIVDSMYSSGLIFQAFASGVRKYLHHFRGSVLSVSQNRTIMEVNFMFRRVMEQMRFLADLCMCNTSHSGGGDTGTTSDLFPTGLKLLSYIYKETQQCCSSVHYPLMLSLLKASCAPYVMFIQDWVFYGVCRDVYSEFMIKVNSDFLQFRDKHYWTMGYILTTQNATESVPMFLSDLANDIFVCGKSINLLRLCCPDHFMCGLDRDIPRVTITFSEQELRAVSDSSAAYTSRMQQIAKYKLISRAERLKLEEKARQDLLVKARQAATAELDRLQARITELRMAEDKKKRKLFDELKLQMEKDLRRRAISVEDEKEADKARIEEQNKRELLEVKADEELEKQAREELVEYYAQLSEEAAAREQRALWRVRRRQLDAERIAYLARENERWRSEMEADQKNDSVESVAKVLDISLAVPPQVPPGDQPVNLLDETISTIPSATDRVSPDQFLSDLMASKQKPEQITKAGPTEVDQAMSEINASVPTENLLELSAFVPAQASGNETPDKVSQASGTMHSEATAKNVLDISIADLPPWTGREFRDVSESGNADVKINDNKGGLQGDLPKWAQGEKHVSCETSEVSEGLHKKIVEGQLISMETEEARQKLHTRVVSGSSASKETEEVVPKSHLRTFQGRQASTESEPKDEVIKKTSIHRHASRESEQTTISKTDRSEETETISPAENDDNKRQPVSDISNEKEAFTGNNDVSSAKKENLFPADFEKGERCKVVDKVTSVGEIVHSKNLQHVSHETREVSEGHHKKFVEGQNAAKESVYTAEKPHLRSVVGQLIGMETEETEQKPHTRLVRGSSASHETEEVVSKSHLKTFQGRQASSESEPRDEVVKKANIFGHASKETEQTSISKKQNIYGHASQETLQTEAITKKASFFGHVSQMSRGEYEVLVPKMKHFEDRYASKESEFDRSFEVVRRRVKKTPHALQETEEASFKPGVRVTGKMYASKESDFVDVDANRLVKFKTQNVYGHSSDSSVEKLLYGGVRQDQQVILEVIEDQETEGIDAESGDMGWVGEKPLPYETNYDRIYNPPATDLTEGIICDPTSGLQEYGITDDRDVDAHRYLSLNTLMKRSLTTPIVAQVSLVNSCLLNYYLHDLKVEEHFTALRRFLLMQDGEFAQMLSDQLFERLSMNPHPQKMLNPAFLNRVLAKAIQTSVSQKSSAMSRLSFALKSMPDMFLPNAVNSLDCLELQYKVDWPINIVITESCLTKYSRVFSFMLQLRRTTWVLKDVVFRLKRSALLHNAGNSTQFRQLQLHRHEMQHFVNIIQGYIANQIIHVTWREFQDHMTNEVHSLDDLHHKHADYLNRAIFRCLLNKKAASVMKVITDIFCLILKFRTQLLSSSWRTDSDTGETTHPAFKHMLATCRSFKEYSAFLFKVINFLSSRGYQPHLQELLLRLNFNNFYQPTEET